MHYDIFNGDADGIIALLQLRLSNPKKNVLITGVKRDINLLSYVAKAKDVSSVTVLDVSMEKNQDALVCLLNRNIPIFYCDHHRSGNIPKSPLLSPLIDLDAEICTSLLINQKLQGRYIHWAIAGAFGDNLHHQARILSKQVGLNQVDVDFLCELGTLINYNSYGMTIDDLHIPPTELFIQLLNYHDPFSLRDEFQSPYYRLKQGYEQDYYHTRKLIPIENNQICRVFELPCEPWARRINGTLGNQLANQSPEQAHAILTLNENQSNFTVSVRAPLNHRTGADEVCSKFPTGGGRKAAAGINALPIEEKRHFIETLTQYYCT